MLLNKKTSGKHMICDIKEVTNLELLDNPDKITEILNKICKEYDFKILNKLEHIFTPQGFTIIYLLAESHISIHTFPENNYFAFDIYTCREYENNSIYEEIYNFLIEQFQAKKELPIIIDRKF